ncbi:hypothetical protein M440DRAFT_1444537 [Trichoderma longibrachiatum ATCC 18648]|uniref:Uncharacterized protein n=1 Tax=Trichoderma longibrachiatum ATCC 18648 TaxID=983965 RepID=A0A2T4CJR3_TRILO|nr:hypothetical protein M440DRAFT_1444537 [Trichoderma longibrachiatum ATCC 18648]
MQAKSGWYRCKYCYARIQAARLRPVASSAVPPRSMASPAQFERYRFERYSGGTSPGTSPVEPANALQLAPAQRPFPLHQKHAVLIAPGGASSHNRPSAATM